jgi:hypothetical protein
LKLVRDHQAKTQEIIDAVEEIHAKTTAILDKDGDTGLHLQRISKELERLKSCSGRDYVAEDMIVDSLYFESIGLRHESISSAHQETFRWILHRSSNNDTKEYPECSLLDWLQTGNGLYWVSGKPGSGKSTLMKFVANHSMTRTALQRWAGSNPFLIATHYFWIAGNPLQKSIEGLLRSLLFEVFVQHPDLIPTAVPERWEAARNRVAGGGRLTTPERASAPMTIHRSWTTREMVEALERLASNQSDAPRFCFFIDGLDEYDGNHQEVASMLSRLASYRNFKVCVSSRPWNVFEDEFGHDPKRKIYIHELTRRDIQRYVTATLQRSSHWRKASTADPRYFQELMNTIVDQAQGVFLWVTIAVQSLLQGLANGDSLSLLEKRIKGFPCELGPFFRHILTSIHPVYYQRMALYFHVLLEAPDHLLLMHYSFLDQCFESSLKDMICFPVQPLNTHEVSGRHQIMERRLNARCMGLIEIINCGHRAEGQAVRSVRVDFLHRSVRDFFQMDEMKAFIAQHLGRFRVNTAMLLSATCVLKALDHDIDFGSGAMAEMMLAIKYAARAQAESPEIVVRCLDEIERILNAIQDKHHPKKYEGAQRMHQLAVQFGLCHYVGKKISVRSPGFEDVSRLLGFAVDAVDKRGNDVSQMVEMLIRAGADVDDALWCRFVRLGSRGLTDSVDIAKRFKTLLDIILPHVKNINHHDPDQGYPVWIPLVLGILEKDWDPSPRAEIDVYLDIIKTLFDHGADPNAYGPSHWTVWAYLCWLVRLAEKQHRPMVTEVLARSVEILVTAGANLHVDRSLTVTEVKTLLPSRLAGSVTEAMARLLKPPRQRRLAARVILGGARRASSWVLKRRT